MATSNPSTWHTGPIEDPTRYRIQDPTPLPGGRSSVFKAVRADGRAVSLKQLEQGPGHEPSDELWGRLAAVDHPRLASVLDVFTGPGLWGEVRPPEEDFDVEYVASEWVEGVSLGHRVPLDAGLVSSVVVDVATGIDALHRRGIVHGDLHPGNVILRPDRRAVVIDLAAATAKGAALGSGPAGTLGFVPPGMPDHADPSSDRWGVGMLAVHALLGHPQARQTDEQLAAELLGVVPRRAQKRAVAVLLQMVAPDPALRPQDLPAWAKELAAALQVQRHRRAPYAAAAAVGIAAMVIGAGVLRASSPPPTRSCPGHVGAGLTERTRVEALREAVRSVAPEACTAGLAVSFGEATAQPVVDHGQATVVLTSPAKAALLLTPAQWTSYREIAGRAEPENAIIFGGYPTDIRSGDAGVAMLLSDSGRLLGPRSDTQSFWMPRQVMESWKAHGGAAVWGYPTSNPYFEPGGMVQDFERGYLEVPAAPVPLTSITAEMVEPHRVADRRAPLRGHRLRGRIVRQRTGTSWYVDQQGRRRWIADGSTWGCLGGDDNLVVNQLPGWAIASLPLGPPATCASAR